MGLDNYTIIELDGDALWWMEFFRLRMAPGAKQEVREFANLCFKIFEELFPRVAKLFKEYTLNREVFAGSQAKALREMLRFLHSTSCEMPPQPGQLAVFVRGFGEKHGLSGGTLAEFVASLTKED
jgi:thymidylate synthase ThyX